ncbi:MAG: phospholipid/cholesterol/gamma-HCH transport system ATP-binding protein, partial [Lysobacterales bacterium]
TKPEVILFDEPTTGLDPMTSKTIHKLIRETQQKRNLTAIIVSHEIPTVFSIVDRVAMLHNGEIIIHTTPDEFQKSENTIVQQFLHGELE